MKRSRAEEEVPAVGVVEVESQEPSHKKAKMVDGGGEGAGAGEGAGTGAGEGDAAAAAASWTKVEKRKKKKAVKNETSTGTAPRFMYNRTEIVRRQHAISIDDVRDLIIHIVADGPPPNWLRIDNANSIQKVVALLVPGLTPELLSLPPLPTSATSNPNLPLAIPLLPRDVSAPTISMAPHIPLIAATFTNACPTRAPGDQTRMHSVLSSFFNGPISGEEKKRRMTLRAQSDMSKGDPAQYLLSLEQMIENGYPIPSYMAGVFQKPPGWVETPAPHPNENKWKQKVYAIDCEMCTTEDGKELTRVCLIDYTSGLVIYDQLVKPQKPILDYLTKYSGITHEQLAPITTTLAQVQEHILRLLSPPVPNPFSSTADKKTTEAPPATPILLGHSLESDLNALKLCHPKCIDTAVIYHHPRGRPLKPALKWLTKKWMNRDIQTRGEGGHDPEEDARACLDLLKKKIENGPGFGEFKMDYESIFERMGRATGRSGRMGGTGSVKSAVVDHGNPATMHGLKATTCISCKTDEEVVEGVLDVLPSHQFVFGRLTGLANVLGWITPKPSADSPQPVPSANIQTEIPPPPSPEELVACLQALNGNLKTIHAALPVRTSLIIFTGHSDPRRMSLLSQRKNAFESGLKSGKSPEVMRGEGVTWTTGDARELEEAVELARRGLMFLGVK